MTRDRLQEMKILMGEEAKKDDDEDMMSMEKPTPLITLCERVRAVRQEICELRAMVKDLKSMMNDNRRWTNHVKRRELEGLIEERKLVIGTTGKSIRSRLKSMKSATWSDKQRSVIHRIKDVQLNSALNELNEVLAEYLNCLLEQREKSLKILDNMIKVKGDDFCDVDAIFEEGKISIFTNNLLIDDAEERNKLREAESRRDEVVKIEASILEVRNLFNELSMIVELQEPKVEQVQVLVDNNLGRVESGRKKIVSASKKRKKIRYRKLIIGLTCGCIILFVLVLVIAF